MRSFPARRSGSLLVALALLLPCRTLRADGTPSASPPQDAAAWVLELKSSDADRRRKAAFALWNLGAGAKDSVPSIAAALRDDDEYVRSVADKILAMFRYDKTPGGLEPAMAELLLGLADARAEVRRLSAANLWRLGFPSGPPPATLGPALVKALADSDAAVRASVAAVVVNFSGWVPETWDALVPLAGDPDKEVRLWSLQALGTLNPVRSLPLQVAALSDPEKNVRVVAAGSLGTNFPGFAPAVVPLTKALSDPEVDVRRAAAISLGAVALVADTSSSVDRLLEMLKDPDSTTKVAAATGLEGTGEAKMIPPLLLALAGEPPADLRAALVSALGGVGPDDAPRVLARLEDALEDEDEGVRFAAVVGLGALGRAAGPAIPALLGARGDESPRVRATALDSLQKAGARGPEWIEALLGGLRDEKASVRGTAAAGLVVLGREATAATPAALDRLRIEEETGTRALLLSFLQGSETEPQATLAAVLARPPKDPDAEIVTLRARAGLSASEADRREAVSALIAALAVEGTRWQALYALRRLGTAAEPAVPAIEALAREGAKTPGMSRNFDLALIELRGKAAKESWNRVLADLAAGDAWSASTLGDLGPAAVEAVPALVAATSSPNSSLRRAAIEALGKIGGSSDAVKTALDAARKDPDVRLRRAAYESQALLGLLPK